ncbi:Bug family tripartite tricarboxylate transporter substrate binding protein [Achromobacter xylosoxidans]|uniref:Bug family tripartite tricarboxylate transporter substrate binding protein n=1 Tax=Alcaligenes xylosoxydans xylosoxydans TaxID=85698 RepID=UPI0006C193DE|nr:tripartite tricarboxylate transporter substrate binding protein [Achromobacter xylosoxidans]MCH4575983.1 tripartite tricarboxylate transporter substrate binding protein [Achromobacter xylosoxidans]MDD7990900.1 tripartite tricarboxylate transporter substrate binding protein [Achromobacter xylosoxidans]NEV08061.1 tripartite tricarboxylate transporter substrate binding protein [Achromobacter xylosoxidans]OFO67554.1 twin-arginine translocation pathway signal protein [Achromobacter xylosoxidans]
MKALRTVIAALLLSAGLPLAQAANAYPAKPITIVYPYAPGSASDTMTRLLAEAMSKRLGQPVIVESKPGAGGSIATEHVVRAVPDGYTLLLSASGTIAVNPHLYTLRYNPVQDLAPISIAVEVPFVFVVGKGFAAQDYAAFKALSHQKPGGLTSANAGLGTQAHLTQASFAKLAGVNLAIVGYKGAAPAVNDVLGGHVDSMMDNAASQIPYVTTGKTTALFVTSDYRFDGYPDVPTARELGITGLVPAGWFGLAAPKGTPAEVIATLRSALAASLDEPPMREKLKALGWVVVGSTPEQALERARTDYERLGQVVRDLGLQPN